MTVRVQTEERAAGRVVRLEIDRRDRANALDSATLSALAEAFEALAADTGLRCAVLASAGERAFSGGADVAEMADLDADRAGPFIGRIHRVCRSIRDLPVPVVARIQGRAWAVRWRSRRPATSASPPRRHASPCRRCGSAFPRSSRRRCCRGWSAGAPRPTSC